MYDSGLLQENLDEIIPTLSSQAYDKSIIIVFKNQTNENLKYDWVNYEGQRVVHSTIEPNTEFGQSTFNTHPWVIYRQDGTLIATYAPQNLNDGSSVTVLTEKAHNGEIFTYLEGASILQNNLDYYIQNLRSKYANIPIWVTFVNQTEHDLLYDWISYDGERKTYLKLNPKTSSNPQNTYCTHPWVIYGAHG